MLIRQIEQIIVPIVQIAEQTVLKQTNLQVKNKKNGR